MEKSESITELAKALVSFQLKIKTVDFDKNNPFYNSRYATLTALVENSKAELYNCNLAVSQLCEDEGSVTTILMHTSGEYILSTLTLKAVKRMIKDEEGKKFFPESPDPQSIGSAITYARRYAYAAILGLVSNEDDDGNTANGIKNKKESNKSTPNTTNYPPSNLITLKDLIIQEGIKRCGDVDKFKVWRVDNNLIEDLDKATDKELQLIRAKICFYKPSNGKT